ncbi:dienelactone hydrolase family protein [Gloeothece verrucosa]|uniref:Dienelactone hydrolase n=1 Tax=Gloeothece verrucosa (strain PCC 7822) TaxID=497965 RepID=E0UKR4_GLOV7|nr:dienelactone hydrolase family protein [Gloeothece verrucosa]ADN17544.1 dienelactone hydrolase [Gloeothece verrucosa PCC 7822]
MKLEQIDVIIPTDDGQMPAFLCRPLSESPEPAIILLMEAFGLTSHIKDVARRIAAWGYVVLAPDLYYRELPLNTFSYDEVEQAMAMMYRLDLLATENDIRAALAYLKSCSNVKEDRIGMTGFCLGGGLTFMSACKFSNEIKAAAPFYGMVFDEWIEAVKNITIPVYLFFGGADPFIARKRIEQIESRFRELDKEYFLKVYDDADHGFFCDERSSYNFEAAVDAEQELTNFFEQYLRL